jgi:hypothetical protein
LTVEAGDQLCAEFANGSGISSPATDEHFHHSDDPAL